MKHGVYLLPISFICKYKMMNKTAMQTKTIMFLYIKKQQYSHRVIVYQFPYIKENVSFVYITLKSVSC